MKRKLVLCMTATFVVAFSLTSFAQDVPEGFTSIFDGKTLDGWAQKNGTATFKVVEGTVKGTTAEGSPNSFMCSEKSYGNFELHFEVKCDPELNSGVQIRSTSKADFKNGRVHGPQVEIAGPTELSGFIYSEGTGRGWISQKRTKHSHFKNDDWNKYRIVANGNRVQTWVNGQAVEDTEIPDAEATSGFIGLQVHQIANGAGPFSVQWRNIHIKEMAATEGGAKAAAPEMEKAKEGMQTAKAMHGTPEIDGKIDEIWKDVPALTVSRDVDYENSLSGDQKLSTASVRCMWDDGHLYCLAEVKDDNIAVDSGNEWEQDSVEFFVDGNLSRGRYDEDDAQYRSNAMGKQTAGPTSSVDKYTSKVTKVDGGYIVEACIKLDTEEGKKIGFDVQVNNDPGTGSRGSITKWSDATNDTWENMSGVGELELAK